MSEKTDSTFTTTRKAQQPTTVRIVFFKTDRKRYFAECVVPMDLTYTYSPAHMLAEVKRELVKQTVLTPGWQGHYDVFTTNAGNRGSFCTYWFPAEKFREGVKNGGKCDRPESVRQAGAADGKAV